MRITRSSNGRNPSTAPYAICPKASVSPYSTQPVDGPSAAHTTVTPSDVGARTSGRPGWGTAAGGDGSEAASGKTWVDTTAARDVWMKWRRFSMVSEYPDSPDRAYASWGFERLVGHVRT